MNFTEIVCVIIILVFAFPVTIYLSCKMGVLGYLHGVQHYYERLLQLQSRQQKQPNHQEGDEHESS